MIEDQIKVEECERLLIRKLLSLTVTILIFMIYSIPITQAAIKQGDRGAEVEELQRILISKGCLNGKVDGICGIETVNAIKKFQASHGLEVDGICGDVTFKLLTEVVDTTIEGESANDDDDPNYAIKYGMKGDDVAELQNILIALGYMNGMADGICGMSTVNAIKSFQASHGLVADGVCGTATFDAINVDAEAFMAGDKSVIAKENRNTTQPTSNSKAASVSAIQFGMHGENVADLQRKLIARGFLSGNADGVCGEKTVAAIRNFQASAGLEADGVAGALTLSRLNDSTETFSSSSSNSNEEDYPVEISRGGYAGIGSVIKPGMHGEGVVDIQQKLIKHGFLTGHADGICGARTVAAIKKFQESVGLKPDGVCGLQTYAALEDADYNLSDTSWEDEIEDTPTLGRSVYVEATAYSPFDPGAGTHTARGNIVRRGIIAVDPRFIPLGTRVYIPGYGEAIADDTGGAIIGNRIDIAFDTYHEAMRFGRQHIEIYILDN